MIENKFFKTSIGIFCILGGCIITFVLATHFFRSDTVDLDEGCESPDNMWVPTKEDIKYQDSMYQIIQHTQSEVDTIKEAMEGIIYKLDRLYYEDGTYDSIRIPVDDDVREMDCGDTLEVKATMYHPVEAQCDSDPLVTADGSTIDPYCVSEWNWIAVSRDLLVSGGGCFHYGDSVYVIAGHKTGWYTIHDTMHRRKRLQIDFLESIGTKVYRYTETKLIVNA